VKSDADGEKPGAMKGSWRIVMIVTVVAGLVLVILWGFRREPVTREIIVPELSATARAGKEVFDRSCASCHGENARGTDKGPTLVHKTYHPGHHADVSFDLAVRRGVRAHHWLFGDMPPQPRVTADEVAQITRYVRELQQANGIL